MATRSENLPADGGDISRPLYKVFSTKAQSYLYDTATNQIMTIPQDLAAYLEKGAFSPGELDVFAEGGCPAARQPGNRAGGAAGVLLPTSALPLSLGPSLSDVEWAVNHECRLVTLEVTRDCNMRCRYCAYSGRQRGRRSHSKQVMSPETALKAVDYLQAHSSASANVGVGFYGGEPLGALPLIKKTTDYARRVITGAGKHLTFTVTTNGTLLSREIMAFLAANDFFTLVSLDGPRELNDRNRVFGETGKGSFDVVMPRLREFQQAHPDYFRRKVRLAMVAAPGTDYVQVADWLTASNLAASISSRVSDDTGQFAQAYQAYPLSGVEELRAQFVQAGCRGTLDEHRGKGEFSLHAALFSALLWPIRRRPVPTPPRDRSIRRGMCIPGSERLFVDCNGDLFPCEKTDGRCHLHLGHVESGVDVHKAYDVLVKFHEFLAQACASCWLWRLCQICLVGPTGGNGYDKDKAGRACESHRRTMTEMLTMYCAILEQNPKGLDCFLNDDATMR